MNGVEMRVVLGGVDIQKDETYDQVIPVERAIVHEGYNHIESPFALYNDVGEASMSLCFLYGISVDSSSTFCRLFMLHFLPT